MKGVKISALVCGNGLPLATVVSPANIHDSQLYLPTLGRLKIKRQRGRPITRPKAITADGAYDSAEIRVHNRRRGIKTNIPVNKRNRKVLMLGRPIKFDGAAYKKRGAVERFFSWIESYKKVFPRYERLEASYFGLVQLACVIMLWRVLG